MKKISILLSVLVIIPGFCLAQWQADMVNSQQGNIQNYTVHSDGSKYRYDYNPGNMNGVVIVDPETNITAIILVDDQLVHYTPSDGMMSRMNDPAQAYQSYIQYGTEEIQGTEEINDIKCIKKVIMQDGKPMITQWYSEKLNFPVKMVVHNAKDTYMELSNIQKWTTDPSTFIVPEGFVEVDEQMRPMIPEPEPPKEWLKTEVSVPVDMPVVRGLLIVVPIDETVYHKLIVENTGETPCKFSYHSFIDGVELSEDIQGPEEYRTQRLHMNEDYKMTLNWKAGQVIKIKVYEGEAQLTIRKE